MSHTYEKISSNKVKLSFDVPAEQFDEAIRQAFLKNRKSISVPGFRKGKAPRAVVERLYGKGVFYEDAFEDLFPDVYRAAVEEYDLHPVAAPELGKMEKMEEGQNLVFEVEVFVRPDVTLGDYKGIEVEITPQKLTDEMVNARIEEDRNKASRAVEVEDRPVEKGDTVKLDYAGTVDGVAFDGGTAQDQELEIGSGHFIPGFEDQMIGMNLGEEKDLQVKFPEDYSATELAGKDAVFHVKVNSIMMTEKPELDDDFASDISEFDTFDEYKADIVKQLTERIEKNNDAMVENAAVEKAAANATIDIPEAMIDDEVEDLISQMRYEMSMQGLKLEQYLSYFKMSLDDIKKQRRGEAETRVRNQLVIDAIRKAEGLEPTEEDIEKATKDQAENYGEDIEDFKAHLTDAQKNYLKDNAAILKVLTFLKDNAKVVEKKPEEKKEEAEEEKPAEETKKKTRRTTKKAKAEEAPAEESGEESKE